MHNQGFSPMDRAVQVAGRKVEAKIQQLQQAADQLRKEDPYYRKMSVRALLLMILGTVLLCVAAWLLKDGIDFAPASILALLPEQVPAEAIALIRQILEKAPGFNPQLLERIQKPMLVFFTGAVVLLSLYKLVMHLISFITDARLRTMEHTGEKLLRKVDSLDRVQQRLQEETASGNFTPIQGQELLGALADRQIANCSKIILINRIVKTVELTLLLLAVYGILGVFLLWLHAVIPQIGLAGTNHALLICAISISALCIFVSFFQKALDPLYQRATKWVLALLLLGYGLALTLWFTAWGKHSLDLITYFGMQELPFVGEMAQIINRYVAPVLLAIFEIHCALRIVIRTDAELERYADENGLIVPRRDGSARIYSAAKARRMGVVVTVRTGMLMAVLAVLLSYAMVNTAGVTLALTFGGAIGIAIVLLQAFSTDKFECKYKGKAGAIQMAMLLVFLLTVLSMMDGNALLAWTELG